MILLRILFSENLSVSSRETLRFENGRAVVEWASCSGKLKRQLCVGYDIPSSVLRAIYTVYTHCKMSPAWQGKFPVFPDDRSCSSLKDWRSLDYNSQMHVSLFVDRLLITLFSCICFGTIGVTVRYHMTDAPKIPSSVIGGVHSVLARFLSLFF